jgi:hypothetical protein
VSARETAAPTMQSTTPAQTGRGTSCLGYLFPAALVGLAVLWVLRKRSARAAA